MTQTHMKERELSGVKRKMASGRSTVMLDEAAKRQEFEDTEEMVQWRSINQEDINNFWKEMCEKMEESLGEVQCGRSQEGCEHRTCWAARMANRLKKETI